MRSVFVGRGRCVKKSIFATKRHPTCLVKHMYGSFRFGFCSKLNPPALDRVLTGGSQERTLLSLVQQGTALANPYT